MRKWYEVVLKWIELSELPGARWPRCCCPSFSFFSHSGSLGFSLGELSCESGSGARMLSKDAECSLSIPRARTGRSTSKRESFHPSRNVLLYSTGLSDSTGQRNHHGKLDSFGASADRKSSTRWRSCSVAAGGFGLSASIEHFWISNTETNCHFVQPKRSCLNSWRPLPNRTLQQIHRRRTEMDDQPRDPAVDAGAVSEGPRSVRSGPWDGLILANCKFSGSQIASIPK